MCLCFLSFLLAPAIAFRSLKSIWISLKNIRKGFEFIWWFLSRLGNPYLRRDQISSESIYEFLLHFDELYSMASEVERKQFMQTFIDRIDIFPERREDGNWIKNISFKFYVPVMKEGKAPANIKGITLDKEDNTGDLVPLEKLMTLETSFLYGFLHY